MSGAALVKNVVHFLKPIREIVIMAPVVYYGLSKVQVVPPKSKYTKLVYFL